MNGKELGKTALFWLPPPAAGGLIRTLEIMRYILTGSPGSYMRSVDFVLCMESCTGTPPGPGLIGRDDQATAAELVTLGWVPSRRPLKVMVAVCPSGKESHEKAKLVAGVQLTGLVVGARPEVERVHGIYSRPAGNTSATSTSKASVLLAAV